MKLYSFTACLIAVNLCGVVWSGNIYEILSMDSELSEFFNQIRLNDAAKYMLQQQSVTVFAPTNDAWSRYQGSVQRDNLWNYHIVKSAISSDRFPDYLPSETVGSLPIWINKQSDPRFRTKYDYFVNQGRIIKIDVKGQSTSGHEQVLHTIDQVLEPTLSLNNNYNFNNPSAFKLLENPEQYGITERLSGFANRVLAMNRQLVLQGGDGHTFFLPVDGNNNLETWDRVDDKVIDGHIIPNKVYFSTAFPPDPQATLAFTDMLKVLLSMKNESTNSGRNYELLVQSNTIIGYNAYPKGSVVAKIVKANIPVKNGVVHLIENPLIIINKNVYQLLEQNSQLRTFYDTLKEHAPDLLNSLVNPEITLFAPTNDAFLNLDPSRLQMVINNPVKVQQMLALHVAPQRVTTESIIQGATGTANTRDTMRKLHFSHTMHNVTVVGGGVNATIVTPDITALNGVVQIINKVMGIPYHSIYEKLASDSSLSSTFSLGQQDNFNQQFQDVSKLYTYFVPHNDAWNTIRLEYPSEFYKLFSGNYVYKAQKMLRRNLIVNNAYSIAELARMNQVQMVDGKFSVYERNQHYYVKWEGETSEIIDADVEAANGKVHVIRKVLFKRSDLTGGSALASPLLSLLTLMLSALLVKFIV